MAGWLEVEAHTSLTQGLRPGPKVSTLLNQKKRKTSYNKVCITKKEKKKKTRIKKSLPVF
jgi:hypothetical protein